MRAWGTFPQEEDFPLLSPVRGKPPRLGLQAWDYHQWLPPGPPFTGLELGLQDAWVPAAASLLPQEIEDLRIWKEGSSSLSLTEVLEELFFVVVLFGFLSFN